MILLETNFACDSTETVLRRFCAYSVKVVLKLTFRVIAQKQSCDVSRVQRESSIETTTSFIRESVKPDSLLVPCYARGCATAPASPALRVVA